MKLLLVTVFLFGISITFVFGQTLQLKQENISKKEAERLWELAIEAKGGREKLHSVKNMVEISGSKVKYSMSKTYEHKVESLSVFPDKVWIWDDNRPSVFGLAMSMYDYTQGMKYHLVSEATDNNPHLAPFELSEQKKIGTKMPGLIYYLIETYWLKPVPQNVTYGKVGSKAVDIVQTKMGDERYDFALDVNTHLPLKVTYYYFEPVTKKNLVNELIFSDYRNFDGIMMPTELRYSNESGVETLSYQFNVEYNPDIFITVPLPVEDAAEAWKVKK